MDLEISRKMCVLFLKIFLLIYPSYTLPSSAERRAGEDRANNGTTPSQQKVLFVNICHRHWLSSARGFPYEFPSGRSGTSGIAVPLPLGLLLCGVPDNARGVLGVHFAVPPARNPLSSTKNHPNYRFLFVFMQKLLYLCRLK